MATRVPELERWEDKSAAEIQDAYAEYASLIDRLNWLNRIRTGSQRDYLFSKAQGRVLDVACGIGTNFRYLPEDTKITAIDITPELLDRARQTADDLGRTVTLNQMDAEALAFESDRFETVISSFSTCTFPNPLEALDEMGRVCKPGGQVLLLEHGKASVRPIARYQEWRADSKYEDAGCRLYDDPVNVVEQSSLEIRDFGRWQLGTLTAMSADPPSL